MWRRAWIDGFYIVVYCGIDEVKKYHLKDLKEDVATTNQKYREYLREQTLQKQKEDLRKEQELNSIKNLKVSNSISSATSFS